MTYCDQISHHMITLLTYHIECGVASLWRSCTATSEARHHSTVQCFSGRYLNSRVQCRPRVITDHGDSEYTTEVFVQSGIMRNQRNARHRTADLPASYPTNNIVMSASERDQLSRTHCQYIFLFCGVSSQSNYIHVEWLRFKYSSQNTVNNGCTNFTTLNIRSYMASLYSCIVYEF